MKAIILTILTLAFAATAQVSVSPDNLTVYSQGATSAYLTFSNVAGVRPAEATWCGDIVPAAPDLGSRCDPSTIFGVLPARYDQSKLNGTRYTDIMSVTPTVARRAYTDAAGGADSRFFFVRRFVSTVGGPDQYVAVTIRLSGNGAGVPFSLTTVKLGWQNGEKVVPFVRPGEKLPPISAEIRYTGTGRLKGRWEIIRPGEPLPERRDLLSEAALPPEERGSQRRWTMLKRFNVNLPPGGRYTLPGPDDWRIDKSIEGMYILLFRVEASDAPDSAVDAGGGRVAATGAVAGFPMPVLRYYVGNSSNMDAVPVTSSAEESAPDAEVRPVTLTWAPTPTAALYRIEIADDKKAVFSAVVLGGARDYKLPPFIRQLALGRPLKWKVTAFASDGRELATTAPADVK